MTKKVYMSKPKANRLYASVILHGRLNEEAPPDADTRYDNIPLHFLSGFHNALFPGKAHFVIQAIPTIFFRQSKSSKQATMSPIFSKLHGGRKIGIYL